MHLVNAAQFLNVAPLSLSLDCISPALSPSPVIAIVSFTSIYQSALSQRLDLNIVDLNLISLFT